MRYVVGSLAAALAVSGGLWLKDRSEVGNLRDAMARSQVQRQFLESALAAERAERDREAQRVASLTRALKDVRLEVEQNLSDRAEAARGVQPRAVTVLSLIHI